MNGKEMNDATYNNSANWYIAPFLGHLQPPKTGTKQNQTSRNTHTTYGISVSRHVKNKARRL